jgi:hypothetical protein
MQIEDLSNIKLDLEGTAAHLEALSKMLRGHAIFLRHSNPGDIPSIETQLSALALSVVDLRDVARNIAKVA